MGIDWLRMAKKLLLSATTAVYLEIAAAQPDHHPQVQDSTSSVPAMPLPTPIRTPSKKISRPIWGAESSCGLHFTIAALVTSKKHSNSRTEIGSERLLQTEPDQQISFVKS